MSEASFMVDVHLLSELLTKYGYQPAGEVADGYVHRAPSGAEVVLDGMGWTAKNPQGREIDFGSTDRDLSRFLHGTQGGTGEVSTDQLDKMPVQHTKLMSEKKAYGLTNQGEENSVCPKCQQPIAEGQMVNYPAGKETHVQCPPGQAQQPGQQAPGWQSRLNLPPGYQQKQQQPAAPAQRPGMISPNVGRPVAGSLLKKADSRFIDDEWRAILAEFGFQPEPEVPGQQEVWWSLHIPLKIAIKTDNAGDIFWVAMDEQGKPIESGQDSDRLASQLSMVTETAVSEPTEEIKWEDNVPKFNTKDDEDFMKALKIQGKLIAKVRKGKQGARKPNFGFAVPLKAAGAVAFHLAKAGLMDFEVINYEEEESSMFAFTNEPEMHLGEEIVRAEFADQIASRKGMWGMWSQSSKQNDDPSLVRSEQELHTPTASEKVAEDPNSYLRGKKHVGPQAVPSRYEAALDAALTALQTLAEVGPSEDIKGCASMSAGDLSQFAEDYKSGKARKFSAEDSESQCCCVVGHLQSKHALIDPAPAQPRMSDAEIKKMDAYRRKKLVTWLNEMGFLDAQGNGEMLAEFDAGDFHKRDALYEEAREMIREDRREQTNYRRTMRGPRPYNRKADLKTAGALDFPTFSKWWNQLKQSPELLKNFSVEQVPGFGGGAGALQINYKGKVQGYLGFPLKEFEGLVGPVKKWLEKSPEHAEDYDPYQMQQVGSMQKKAFDPALATFVGTWVTLMLGKWLGDKWKQSHADLGAKATAKAEEALQKAGVYDLGTLDKYAQENGTNRFAAFLKLAGSQLALAAAITVGVSVQKLMGGGTAAPAPQAQTQQVQPTEKTDMWVEQVPQEAPVAKPAPRPSKEQLKQQQKQRDQQVMEQIRQQDKDRAPQGVV